MERNDFVPLLVIAAIAFVAPVISHRSRRVKIPVIVLEILLGIALGKGGLGLIEPTDVVEFLSEFGFIFLMFLSGFELFIARPTRPAAGRWRRVAVYGAMFAATAAGSLAGALVLFELGWIRDPVLFALILSTTSVGVVLPTLKERGEISGRFGQAMVISATVADLTTVSLLTIYVVHTRRGATLQLLLVLAIFVVFAAAYGAAHLLKRWSLLARILGELAHASTQLKVRGAFVLLILFVVFAHSLGIEVIIAAFLAGVLLSAIAAETRATLAAKLDAIGYGLFVPVFFVMVGAKLDVAMLLASARALALVPVLIVMAFAVKVLPALLLAREFGMRQAFAGGVLLASRLALIIAASAIALELGAISETVNAAVVITAMVTCLGAPVLYSRLRGPVRSAMPRVILAGAGRIGRETTASLLEHGLDVVVIEQDEGQLEKLRASPAKIIVGDCTDDVTLAGVGIGPRDVFVALTGSDEQNLEACLRARERYGVRRTIARDHSPRSTRRFLEAGVTPLRVSRSLAQALLNLVLRPTLVDVLGARQGDLFAFEVVLANPSVFGRKVCDLHELGGALLILVRSGETTAVPHGDTVLEQGDCIVVLGNAEQEGALRRALC